ncbi:OsmC family protein [Thiohalorhabdus sp. Cl-TMA]|uniref:OsmC family protein n=1 Tax=Thiohalorhabdus methylotrophus TaxID=3242694 RepID=A0ABV4TXC6_9GAMM
MGRSYEVEVLCTPQGEITCSRPSGIGPSIRTGPKTDSEDGTPMDHLAVGLGSCLLHFAQNFLERRQRSASTRIVVTCAVDQKRCEIEQIQADLTMDIPLSEEDRNLLIRFLKQCPIHKALDVWTPVELHIASEAD